jgi:hypothetical protein
LQIRLAGGHLALNLELEPRDGEVLAAVLEDTISDLRMEIANTDSLDFRQELKAREEVLKRLLGRLRTAAREPVSGARNSPTP